MQRPIGSSSFAGLNGILKIPAILKSSEGKGMIGEIFVWGKDTYSKDIVSIIPQKNQFIELTE